MSATIWDRVVGQPTAVALLTAAAADPVHAYLFVGPAGSTKLQAARAFAALLLDPTGDPAGRDARLAAAGEHPMSVRSTASAPPSPKSRSRRSSGSPRCPRSRGTGRCSSSTSSTSSARRGPPPETVEAQSTVFVIWPTTYRSTW